MMVIAIDSRKNDVVQELLKDGKLFDASESCNVWSSQELFKVTFI